MARLEGRTIAVTGPRKADEMSRMIEKFGGRALARPAQGTVFMYDTRIEEQLKDLIDNPADWLVLTTGVGTEALMDKARQLGYEDAFLAALKRMRLAARGYKTVNVLRRLGLTPDVRDNDGTTAGLLGEMASYSLEGRRVALQLYGDPAPRVTGALAARGAICEELLPYRHVAPEGDVVERLIGEIIGGEVDAVAFTSTVQVRYVMGSAVKRGVYVQVLAAFETRVLAVAVGKVTAEALFEEGVKRVLFPEEERMGSMVVAMSRHFGGMEFEEDAVTASTTGICASGNDESLKSGEAKDD
ncbi:uroporphyrinogen-III synthase [Paenibacillus darwinianus]|uniref:uroporphyrinogen-III synthase n=1 Tax=Paenibacillus darwinianus TaxID=1380763 RepID=UPI00044E4AD0|nr:uroporphyrinogen-III synthase [Paenibacillus darwinianus]EXX86060.1 uroporphyrinogen-III synthase [Paenibacillus darwinianus]